MIEKKETVIILELRNNVLVANESPEGIKILFRDYDLITVQWNKIKRDRKTGELYHESVVGA